MLDVRALGMSKQKVGGERLFFFWEYLGNIDSISATLVSFCL